MNPSSNLNGPTPSFLAMMPSYSNNSRQGDYAVFAEREVSIEGLSKALVLKSLYDYACGHGRALEEAPPELGLFVMRKPMDIKVAQRTIEEYKRDGRKLWFDYVNSKPIKTNISENTIDATSYDNNHGLGAANDAIMLARLSMAGQLEAKQP